MIKSEEKTMNPQDCKKTVIFNSIVEEKKKKKTKRLYAILKVPIILLGWVTAQMHHCH